MYYTVQTLETLSVFEKGFFFFVCNAVAGRRDSHQTRMLTHFLLPPLRLLVVLCPNPWGWGGWGSWGGTVQTRGTDGRFSPKEKKQERQRGAYLSSVNERSQRRSWDFFD